MEFNLDGIVDEPSTLDAVETARERFEVLGRGVARIVIVDPSNSSYVFKIGIGLQGYRQNKNEVMIHQKTRGLDVHDRLLSVVDYDSDFRWVKFPRVDDEIDCPLSTKFCGPSADYIARMLDDHGIEMRELETAIVDSTAVAYDYGSPENISSS